MVDHHAHVIQDSFLITLAGILAMQSCQTHCGSKVQESLPFPGVVRAARFGPPADHGAAELHPRLCVLYDTRITSVRCTQLHDHDRTRRIGDRSNVPADIYPQTVELPSGGHCRARAPLRLSGPVSPVLRLARSGSADAQPEIVVQAGCHDTPARDLNGSACAVVRIHQLPGG